ncbi:MAG: hypothetical protein E6Q97_15910 [Desulfurellales bacterium]|nr:MAG: hypothetical protein E6Q97_15910 [Desulfurellales bacterium]
MSRIPTIMALLGLVLGLALPLPAVWALIYACTVLAACLSVVLVALVVRRSGHWAFAWRGQRAFVAVGVSL